MLASGKIDPQELLVRPSATTLPIHSGVRSLLKTCMSNRHSRTYIRTVDQSRRVSTFAKLLSLSNPLNVTLILHLSAHVRASLNTHPHTRGVG